jgi:asparagine synthase (glutamine-hydrolysing)
VDHELIDLMATVPASMRIKGPTGENILRTLMQRHMPPELLDRPKRGFAPPMPEWLRGPLRPVLQDYASPERVAAAGIFDPQAITRLVDDHMAGRRDNHVPLRYFLMFELWRERWLGRQGQKPS